MLQVPRPGAAAEARGAYRVIRQRHHRADEPDIRGRYRRGEERECADRTGLDNRHGDVRHSRYDTPPGIDDEREPQLVFGLSAAAWGAVREHLCEFFEYRLGRESDGRRVRAHERTPENTARPCRHVATLELFEKRALDLCRLGDFAERDLCQLPLISEATPEVPLRRAHHRSARCSVSHSSLTTPS